jgi:hypothetical protein
MSTAYHPQTDGETERVNQELETYLRIFCANEPRSWSTYLPMAEFAHNNRAHETSKMSRSLHSPTCSTWIPGIFQVFLKIGFGRDPQPNQTWSAPEFDLDFQVLEFQGLQAPGLGKHWLESRYSHYSHTCDTFQKRKLYMVCDAHFSGTHWSLITHHSQTLHIDQTVTSH